MSLMCCVPIASLCACQEYANGSGPERCLPTRLACVHVLIPDRCLWSVLISRLCSREAYLGSINETGSDMHLRLSKVLRMRVLLCIL